MKKRWILFFILIESWNHIYGYSLKKIGEFSTGACPKSVLISPDKKIGYTLNLEGMSVWAFSTKTYQVLWKIYFPKTPAQGFDYINKVPIHSYANKPVEGAFTENGRYLWVSLHNAKKVVVIDTQFSEQFDGETMPVTLYKRSSSQGKTIYVKSIHVGDTPKVITISPDQKYAYVANWFSASITVINTQTFQVEKTIPAIRLPRGISFLPDSQTGFVANQGSEKIQSFSENTNMITGTYHVGQTPRHIVSSQDGTKLYITLNWPGEIIIFDPQTKKVLKTAQLGGEKARTCALSPDEKYIYVVLYNSNKMAVLEAHSLKKIQTISTNNHPIGVTAFDDQVWLVNYSASTLSVFKVES